MSSKSKPSTSSPLRSSTSSSSSLGVSSSGSTSTLTSRPSTTLRTPSNPAPQIGANSVITAARKSSLTSMSSSSSSGSPTSTSAPTTISSFSSPSAAAAAAAKKPIIVPAIKTSSIGAAFVAPGLSAASLISPQSFAARLDDRMPASGLKKIRSSSSRFRTYGSVELTKLPGILDVSLKDRPALVVEKMRQCTNVFNFADPTADIRSKDIKRAALNDLLNFFQDFNQNNPYQEEYYPEMFKMFAANVFRVVPPPPDPNAALYDPEEDEPTTDPAYPHLELVYKSFQAFLDAPVFQPAVAKKYISNSFLDRLVEVLDCEDAIERDAIKMVMHRIYGKLCHMRTYFRRVMTHTLLRFIYETEQYFGITEILEILGSIINGFVKPLKAENALFYRQVILPLLKCKPITQYHSQLGYCLKQFVEKEETLLDQALETMLKYWPIHNSTKELVYLNFLEELFSNFPVGICNSVHAGIFQQLAKCICNKHFQVVERTLLLFNNNKFADYLKSCSSILVPILFPVMYRQSKLHWNKNVLALLVSSLKVLSEIDLALFEDCTRHYKSDQQKKKKREREKEERWRLLELKASQNPLSKMIPIIPYESPAQSGSVSTETTPVAAATGLVQPFEGMAIATLASGQAPTVGVRRKSMIHPQGFHQQ